MIGSWILNDGLQITNLAANSKLDFLVLDYEHGSAALSQASVPVTLIQLKNKIAVIRIGDFSKLNLQKARDAYPNFIQVSGISSGENFEELFTNVEQIGYSPWTRFGSDLLNQVEIIPQVEDERSLEWFLTEAPANLPIKNIFLGRYDLARNLNHKSLHSDEHYKIVKLFSDRCRELAIRAWIICTDQQDYKNLREISDDFEISFGSDFSIYVNALSEIENWRR